MPEPYFWTPSTSYTGYPNKAVVAGKDDDGSDIWVGRAKHDGQWTPAKVVHSKKVAYVPYGGKEHVKTEYDILVAANDGPGLIWVEREAHYAIPAGAVRSKGFFFTGENLYVGRASYDGKLIPGKIVPNLKCIFVPYGGLEHKITSKHEILVVKEN